MLQSRCLGTLSVGVLLLVYRSFAAYTHSLHYSKVRNINIIKETRLAMASSTITSKGQITIPIEVRTELGIVICPLEVMVDDAIANLVSLIILIFLTFE